MDPWLPGATTRQHRQPCHSNGTATLIVVALADDTGRLELTVNAAHATRTRPSPAIPRIPACCSCAESLQRVLEPEAPRPFPYLGPSLQPPRRIWPRNPTWVAPLVVFAAELYPTARCLYNVIFVANASYTSVQIPHCRPKARCLEPISFPAPQSSPATIVTPSWWAPHSRLRGICHRARSMSSIDG